MKKLFLFFFLLISISAIGQTIQICSWNLQNFGKSKTDEQILFIAKALKNYDIIAIQEVVAGPGGPQAVARLHDELNRTGAKWAYSISHGTSGDRYSKERYAYLWKTAKTSLVNEPWLEKKYNLEINREPYMAQFKLGKKQFTLVSLHAIPKTKQPETEIKYLQYLPEVYPHDVLIFLGDFNLPESHSVFYPLKRLGYPPALQNQKTTLRQKCIQGDRLASAYDNFFYKQAVIQCLNSGVVHFYNAFADLKEARKISDHLPVFLQFSM